MPVSCLTNAPTFVVLYPYGYSIHSVELPAPLRNIDDIYFFLDHLRSVAICLQEAHLNPNNANFFRWHTSFRKGGTDCNHSSGGVAGIAQGGIACSQIHLVTSLETAAMSILLDRPVTLCSLYIPPSRSLRLQELHARSSCNFRQPFLF